jgi:chromosome segregation ATPase
MTDEDTLIQKILEQIQTITQKEITNKGFVTEIKTEVENLKPLVDKLLNQIVLNITSLNSELDKYNELDEKYKQLVQETEDLKTQFQDMIRQMEDRFAQENKSGEAASAYAIRLQEEMNSLRAQISNLENEKAALNAEKDTLNSRIQKLNEGLKQIQIQLEDLNNNVIQSSELTDILTKIKEFTSYVNTIDINTLFGKQPVTGRGGRRRHGRKHSTKKMKKGMKKGMMMRGGFIAEYNYKSKTHRRRNNKKRYIPSSRSKKTSRTTSKSTSSY